MEKKIENLLAEFYRKHREFPNDDSSLSCDYHKLLYEYYVQEFIKLFEEYKND